MNTNFYNFSKIIKLTELVLMYDEYSCPYLISEDGKCIILFDPSYHDYKVTSFLELFLKQFKNLQIRHIYISRYLFSHIQIITNRH